VFAIFSATAENFTDNFVETFAGLTGHYILPVCRPTRYSLPVVWPLLCRLAAISWCGVWLASSHSQLWF